MLAPADGSTDDAWVTEAPLPTHLGGSHATVVELQPRGAGKQCMGAIAPRAKAGYALLRYYLCYMALHALCPHAAEPALYHWGRISQEEQPW